MRKELASLACDILSVFLLIGAVVSTFGNHPAWATLAIVNVLLLRSTEARFSE